MSEVEVILLNKLVLTNQIELGRGDVISRIDIENNPGPYPIYSSSAHNNGKFGEYGNFMFDEELISWSVDGGGDFFYRPKHQFSITNVSGFMRIKDKELDCKFVFYSLALQHGYLTFDYTTKAHPSVIRKFYSLPVMSKETQQKIATILSSIDTAIEKTEALINKYQQIKAGLMQDLFTRGVTVDGKLRPPREQAPELYQETPIGWIPKEWTVEKLEKVLQISGGYLQTGPFGSQLHAHEYTAEGVPVVMPQDIDQGNISIRAVARITEKRAQTLIRHRLKVDDIIIARRGELSRAAAISKYETGWVCGTGCFLLRLAGSKLNSSFFSHIYRHDMIQRQIAGLSVGTTMPSLNNSVMNALYFPLLEPKEQDSIVKRLDSIENQLELMLENKVKFEKQKQGLMQDLLTGKVRVNVN